MNFTDAERIADAVLYEGYLLYPCRANASLQVDGRETVACDEGILRVVERAAVPLNTVIDAARCDSHGVH